LELLWWSTSAVHETKMISVTAEVIDDYAHASQRANRTQYRLEFPIGTNNDGLRDNAQFVRTGFKLHLTYELP
jgi:hypothetical protein